MSEQYDITVIGSGPGGYRAAVLAALRGKKVAIVEKAEWGGCCLNRGCVPKKDWHHTAQLVAQSEKFANRGIGGIDGGKLTANMDQAWEHQKEVVTTIRDSYTNYMKRVGIDSYTGFGSLQDATTVVVTKDDGSTESFNSAHTIIATGSSPFIPDGIETVADKILTSDMLFDNPAPKGKRVALMGSGVIGTEFAFIFSMLGKEVTWITGSEPLSKTLFTFQAKRTLNEAFKHHGIEPKVGARVSSATVEGDEVKLTLANGETETVDWLCLATGRIPYTDNVGLDVVGVDVDNKGFIVRNKFLQTSCDNIYAIGDCTSPEMTANQALADAATAVNNIIDGNHEEQDPMWVPEAIYSAVEMARLGMDDDMAEDEELEPAVGFAAFETSPRAMGQDDVEGHVRLLADMDSGEVLGGEIIGAEAAELIHLLALAPDKETALNWLAHGKFNHPSRMEELLNASETLANKWGLKDEIFGRQ